MKRIRKLSYFMMTNPAAVATLYIPTQHMRVQENTTRFMSKRRKIFLHEVFESNCTKVFKCTNRKKSHRRKTQGMN